MNIQFLIFIFGYVLGFVGLSAFYLLRKKRRYSLGDFVAYRNWIGEVRLNKNEFGKITYKSYEEVPTYTNSFLMACCTLIAKRYVIVSVCTTTHTIRIYPLNRLATEIEEE